jgi:hypothetical protein
MTPLTYPNWAGRTWTIDSAQGEPDANIGDTVSFAYLPPMGTPEKLTISDITSPGGVSHKNWKGVECKSKSGAKDAVTGNRDHTGFSIECSDNPHKPGQFILTCRIDSKLPNSALRQDAGSGGNCWTANDGG